MKKKMILNICMVIMICLVIICGVVAVGSVKGWFDRAEDVSGMVVTEKNGIAMIERSGIAYEVESDTAIRKDDRLYTKTGSALTVSDSERARVYLGENGEIRAGDLTEGVRFEVVTGEALIDARNWKEVKVYSGGTEVILDQTVASVSTQAGTSMIYVYSGEAIVDGETVSSGNVASIVDDGAVEVSALQAAALSEFQMEKLLACGLDDTFAITEKEIEQVKADREAERLQAQQELLAAEEAEKEKRKETESTSSGSAQNEDTTTGNKNDEDKKYCTIQIRCDTILNNLGNLTSGKEAYVPSNGIILATSELAFEEGETVFDVLQRACNLAGIQIEYSYTPIYESYYIEGLNHIYEFDCGNQSGWMYKVNGWFPNYGCSSYTLQDGDNIVWLYTCNGLGADIGGSNY